MQEMEEISSKEKNGVLILNKPIGMTSHDLVNIIRKFFNIKKVGHTGTLDPDAQGVMIVALGRATKFIRFFSDTNKTYHAQILFGNETDTYDISGKIMNKKEPTFSAASLKDSIGSFAGKIMQRPPIFSALKKDGRHYYEYARQGIQIDIPKREVEIFDIQLLDAKVPFSANIRIKCSSGTYIRSLCHDIGLSLGTYACMGKLERTAIGRFDVEQSFSISDLEKMNPEQRMEVLLPVDDFLSSYRTVQSNVRGDRFIKNGNKLFQWNALDHFDNYQDSELLKIYDSQYHFVGMGKYSQSDNFVYPIKMF
ncbi:tRNA pseudouridine(55) synthase TruB [Pseudoramibacter porci]|uniref:tRNA pseudouridine synthase B n=1 Tax=Pseudoramibacter porci TaxID=2606631 RepID=A0A7X2TAD3_9FIRM|nr:tRNA pseudouridine(55) synthase TruB [Pseudoramibacter porci]MSS19960.1 tRNA pseudouridine(55) synthase TruB [Pseudoramibacter porci]